MEPSPTTVLLSGAVQQIGGNEGSPVDGGRKVSYQKPPGLPLLTCTDDADAAKRSEQELVAAGARPITARSTRDRLSFLSARCYSQHDTADEGGSGPRSGAGRPRGADEQCWGTASVKDLFSFEGSQADIDSRRKIRDEETRYLLNYFHSLEAAVSVDCVPTTSFCDQFRSGILLMRILHKMDPAAFPFGLQIVESKLPVESERAEYLRVQQVLSSLATSGCSVSDIAPDDILNAQ
jgi:hypothetical protein